MLTQPERLPESSRWLSGAIPPAAHGTKTDPERVAENKKAAHSGTPFGVLPFYSGFRWSPPVFDHRLLSDKPLACLGWLHFSEIAEGGFFLNKIALAPL